MWKMRIAAQVAAGARFTVRTLLSVCMSEKQERSMPRRIECRLQVFPLKSPRFFRSVLDPFVSFAILVVKTQVFRGWMLPCATLVSDQRRTDW